MTRNLKALGLALVAVFALSAMAASGASAASHHFTSTATPEGHTFLRGEPTTGEATNPWLFKTTVDEIECKKKAFVEGTSTIIKTPVKEVTVQPKYEECEGKNKKNSGLP